VVSGGPCSRWCISVDVAAVLRDYGQDFPVPALKHAGCAILFVGILAQSGGFFIHMLVGNPDQASIGNTVTVIGAVLLTLAIAVQVYGLSTTH
jgi:hypothetical protein